MPARKEVFAPYRRKHCLVFLFQAFMTFKLLSVKEDGSRICWQKNSGFLRWPLVLCAQLYAWMWKNFRGTPGLLETMGRYNRTFILLLRLIQGAVLDEPDLWGNCLEWSTKWFQKVIMRTTYSFTAESPLTGFRELCYSPCLRCHVRPFERVQRYFSTIISHVSIATMRTRHSLSAAPLTPDSFVQRQRLTQRL